MEVDLRSTDPVALGSVDASLHEAIDEALLEENQRWAYRGQLRVERELIGTRPMGQTPAASPIVQAAVSVTEALGLPVSLGAGSTDANIAMSMQIPAITIDGGGRGSLAGRDVRFDRVLERDPARHAAGHRAGGAVGAQGQSRQ